jgi:outer membrane receptor protein involved in Fe transport
MKSILTTLTVYLFFLGISLAQSGFIKGNLINSEGPVIYANIALYSSQDSSLIKVATSDEDGLFRIPSVLPGKYYLKASYVGLQELVFTGINLTAEQELDLGPLEMLAVAQELETAVVKAQRAMVEVKPDRTVFNVEGTVNSIGDDGIELLRKAPGVLIDNNNNISVLGRSGVRIFINGKRLPLEGEELSNYLQNLSAEQIDRIDIITNPGARYEAEGNAGIIDIRLKKSDDAGANGSLSSTISQGRYLTKRINATGNYKNKRLNAYGSLGWSDNERFNQMIFDSYQNGVFIAEKNRVFNEGTNYLTRFGADFNLSDNHSVGIIVSQNFFDRNSSSNSKNEIASIDTPNQVDSLLIASSLGDNQNISGTYNINYRYNKGKSILNIDLDYGQFNIDNTNDQPNLYYDAEGKTLLSTANTYFETGTNIDIATFKLDYENSLFGGTIGLGTKISQVVTDNTFLFFDVPEEERIRNDLRSNIFEYDEKVYAAYINYQRKLSDKWNMSAGLRSETTDAVGELMPFLSELAEDPVKQDYTNLFPNIGLTYSVSRSNTLSLNYGRRINRPEYDVLNPFEGQLSELSFRKGNPFLIPEIVNNIEIGYTLKYRYNFKLAYSQTTDQITRLISPDDKDPRAGFITWENLAKQTVYSANISAPVSIGEVWNAFFNLNASYIDNQADYGDGAIVDVQAFSYNIYQQHSFNLPKGFVAEISGWYNGPGIWGGVFEYDPTWSLNLGLQKRFFQDKLNVKLSGNDLFYETGWSGYSEFNGLRSEGRGNWDSRRATLSLSYNFGNKKLKVKSRKSGLEEESSRVSNQ